MATIIWCDRVKHIVNESRTDIAKLIDTVSEGESDGISNWIGPKFIYVTVQENRHGVGGQQRALNVQLISTFEAHPGDSI